MSRKIIAFIGILFIVAGCNKEQKTVRSLFGSWVSYEVIFVEENGSQTDVSGGVAYTFEFNKCKLEKKGYCLLQLSQTINGEINFFSYIYRIIDDGETVEAKQHKNVEEPDLYTINELTNRNLVLELTSESFGLIISLEKM